jgi:hypothetical protein
MPHQFVNLGACQLHTKHYMSLALTARLHGCNSYLLLDMCLVMGAAPLPPRMPCSNLHTCTQNGWASQTSNICSLPPHPCVCAVHGGSRLGDEQGGSPDEVQSLQGGWCSACPCTQSVWQHACCQGRMPFLGARLHTYVHTAVRRTQPDTASVTLECMLRYLGSCM